MAIANMSEVLVLGRKRDNLEVIRALQEAGVVQIDPLEASELPKGVLNPADAERKATLERQLARVESTLAAIDAVEAQPDFAKYRASNFDAMLEEVAHRADVLSKERTELNAELAAIGGFGSLARALGDLSSGLGKSGRVAAIGFTLTDAKDRERLETNLRAAGLTYEIGTQSVARGYAAVLAVRMQDAGVARTALSRSGLAELRFPGRFEGMAYSDAASLMDQRSRLAPEESQSATDGLERIKREHAGTLAAARGELKDELVRFDTVSASVAGKYGFALRGWVPKANHANLENALAPFKGQVIAQFSDAPEHHADHVPVKLENSPILKPFERLLGILPLPAYGTFDPTWVLAIFFPLFFGWIIGDVGYGLVSILVGLLFGNMARAGKNLKLDLFGANLGPGVLSDVSKLLFWMGGASIIFGFVFGEMFGTFGEYIGLFKFAGETENALITAPIHRVASSATGIMLFISLMPGIIQVLGGWLLRAYLGAKHHDTPHLLEGAGMFLAVGGMLPWVLQFALGWSFPGWVIWVQLAVIVFGVFVLGTIAKKTMVMGIELLTNFSNLLSYLRLYAVGLSGAVLANLASDTGWALGNQLGGPVGVVAAILAASVAHLLFIAFTIIGHILTPLRLHYVEFFTKFGYYDHNGRAYRPLAKTSGQAAQ
jgi:V/A-type H+/Na+-transporting ATPase subunit I